uniref:Uncharacterized protein n=1 Tax=viral metagenome TaxID=1070528 RepID=A0A6M3K6S6_9ZZZZ
MIEVIRPSGDLRREVWEFDITIDYSRSYIYLRRYSFQTKETKRHKWKAETHWERFDRRNNNIAVPPIPLDVDKEIHARYQEYINTLPIEQ